MSGQTFAGNRGDLAKGERKTGWWGEGVERGGLDLIEHNNVFQVIL